MEITRGKLKNLKWKLKEQKEKQGAQNVCIMSSMPEANIVDNITGTITLDFNYLWLITNA